MGQLGQSLEQTAETELKTKAVGKLDIKQVGEEMGISVKRWLRTYFFLMVAAFSINTTLAITIWDQTSSFSPVISYHLYLFTAILPSAIITALMLKAMDPVITLGISIISWFFLGVLATISPELLLTNIPIFGFITGLANTTLFMTSSFITTNFINNQNPTGYQAESNKWRLLAHITVPIALTSSFLIYKSPIIPLSMAAVSSLIALVLSTRLRFATTPKQFAWRVFGFPSPNPERHILTLLAIGYGIRDGIFWALFSVVVLMVLGSVEYWGIATILFTFISYITNHYLKKLTVSPIILKQILFGFGVLYTASIVLFIANPIPLAFIGFAAVDAIFFPLLTLSYQRLSMELGSLDPDFSERSTEYTLFNELAVGVGRLIPLIALGPLFINATSNSNNLIIFIVFIVISLIPTALLGVLQSSRLLA
jgi:hypothetical protein